MKKKLYRDMQQGALSGVCAGLGTYLEIDKTWVRLAFVMSVIFASWLGLGMLGPIAYIVLWIVVPTKPKVMPSTWYGDSAQSPYDVDYRVDSENLGQRGASDEGGFDRQKGHPDYQEGMGLSGEVDAWTSWEDKKEKKQQDTGRDRHIAGLMLILVGLFFLLNQLDILSMREIFKYWPVLLILTGIMVLFGAFIGKKKPDVQPEPQASREENDRTAEDSGPNKPESASESEEL